MLAEIEIEGRENREGGGEGGSGCGDRSNPSLNYECVPEESIHTHYWAQESYSEGACGSFFIILFYFSQNIADFEMIWLNYYLKVQ